MHFRPRLGYPRGKTPRPLPSFGQHADLFKATMTDEPKGPMGLNRTRIFLLAMGAFVLLITISMMMGGLGDYNALKEASNAARNPTAEQLGGN